MPIICQDERGIPDVGCKNEEAIPANDGHRHGVVFLALRAKPGWEQG